MAKTYAQVVGVVLLLLGIVGLVAGETILFNLVNVTIFEDITHLVTGAILAYFGFTRDNAATRPVAGVLGVLYLLVGILGFVSPTLFGILPANLPYTVADNIVHLALGVLGIATGFLMGAGEATTPART